MQENKKQLKGAVAKIRKFREDFYNDYIKCHKRFDIHQFTADFLKKPSRNGCKTIS